MNFKNIDYLRRGNEKQKQALPFFNGLAYVELNGKVGYIDCSGEEVIPIDYKPLWYESDGMIRFAE